jgi:hypothetical protein
MPVNFMSSSRERRMQKLFSENALNFKIQRYINSHPLGKRREMTAIGATGMRPAGTPPGPVVGVVRLCSRWVTTAVLAASRLLDGGAV